MQDMTQTLEALRKRKEKAESLPAQTRAQYRTQYERICTQVSLIEGSDPLLIEVLPEILRSGVRKIYELDQEIGKRMLKPDQHIEALTELLEMWRGEWRMLLTVCNALPASEVYEQLQLVDGAEVPEGWKK